MQWFIGINGTAPNFKAYSEMAKVAVHTALLHTSLEPHCIYDGEENDFTAWLRRRAVRILPARTFLYHDLARMSERRNDVELLTGIPGVFLRVELPELQRRFGLDERVLYTDCDVFFRREVVDALAPVQCKYFAVAVESDVRLTEDVNTGVMWMNLPAMFERDQSFRQYLRDNLETLPTVGWDQGAYRDFYRAPDGAPLWENLPPELNWKPYWEENPAARIIHFHGPKPFQRHIIDSRYPELKYFTGGNYEKTCDLWEALLKDAE